MGNFLTVFTLAFAILPPQRIVPSSSRKRPNCCTIAGFLGLEEWLVRLLRRKSITILNCVFWLCLIHCFRASWMSSDYMPCLKASCTRAVTLSNLLHELNIFGSIKLAISGFPASLTLVDVDSPSIPAVEFTTIVCETDRSMILVNGHVSGLSCRNRGP